LSDPTYRQRYGAWALVTGGADGIGGAFADQLGERGLDVLVLDVNGDGAEARAEKIRRTCGVQARSLVVDLSEPEFYEKVRTVVDELEVGMLVCNAGIGTPGGFFDLPLSGHLKALDVNCRAALVLTHSLGARMVERGRGGIILVGSDAAYQGTPYVASYAATKAFNLILGEGLWYEGREDGVDVLGFAPGPTNTEGQRRGNPRLREGATPKGFMLPEPTARAALAALGRVPSTRPDWWNRLETFIAVRLLSRRRAVERIGRRTRTLRRAPRTRQEE
jgi:short-subunit dehydrogenase